MQELPGPELFEETTSKFMGRCSELTRLPGLSGSLPRLWLCTPASFYRRPSCPLTPGRAWALKMGSRLAGVKGAEMNNPPSPPRKRRSSRLQGAGLGDWEAGLGLADWIGARPEEASGPRPSQTWLCARSGPGGERGAGEGEREGPEVLGRWPGSEVPGWPEVGLRVRGRPPLTSTGPHAGHGRPGLSFPRCGSRGLVSSGRGGVRAVIRAAQAGSLGSRGHV